MKHLSLILRVSQVKRECNTATKGGSSMKKSKGGQSAHDQKVKQIANRLKRENWKVKANVPGQAKPHPIGKDQRVPDIEASKGGRRRIIEVETPDSLKKDKAQQSTFRRHAAQKSNTTFDIKVTD